MDVNVFSLLVGLIVGCNCCYYYYYYYYYCYY